MLFSLSRPIIGKGSYSKYLKELLILVKLARMVLRRLFIPKLVTSSTLSTIFVSRIPKFVIRSIILSGNSGYRRL